MMNRLSGHSGILKSSRDNTHIHKDKYWVADLSKRTLECFNNDNDVIAKVVLNAQQIQSVTEETDRQNKFFDFKLVTTTKDGEYLLRCQSQQDRDKWVQVIQSLISNERNFQLTKQFISAMESRCEGAATKFGLRRGKVAYAGSLPLSQVPSPMWKIYLSAVEEAIRVGERVLKDPAVSVHQIIKHVRIYLINGYQPNVSQTSYDEQSGTLNLAVTLLSPTGRSVHFKHEEVDVILQMILPALNRRSKVLPMDTKHVEAVRKINAFLQSPATDDQVDFEVRYRYTDGRERTIDPKSSAWRRYYDKYINTAFFSSILQSIKQAASPVVSQPVASSTAPFGGSGSSFQNTDAAPANHPLSPGAELLQALTPLDILQEMLVGVILELPAIDSHGDEERYLSSPPKLTVLRRHGEGKTEMSLMRTRVALLRYRNVVGGTHTSDPFLLQLSDLILQVQVASRCSLAEEGINMATGCREKCIVHWGSLLDTVSKAVSDLSFLDPQGTSRLGEHHLPSIVNAVGTAYCLRIEAAIDRLKAEPTPPSAWVGGIGEAASLYESGYLRCIAGNTLVFSEGRPATHVSRGLLGEISSVTLQLPDERAADALPYTDDPNLPTLHLSFFSNLGEWMKIHFIDSNGLMDVAPQFDSNGVAVDDINLQQNHDRELLDMQKEEYLAQQENVAIARSSEISALRMMDITRIVSDRQRQVRTEDGSGGRASDYLTASDLVIHAGVRALDECFMDGKIGANNTNKLIDKQDIVKILSVSLFRLRVLFDSEINPVGSIAFSRETRLNVAQATAVLKNFCDYRESESSLLPGPDNRLFRLHRETGDTTDISAARFTFDDVGLIALTSLLPNETRLAALARRDVLVIGLDNSGKSTIINHIRHQTSRETLATIGIAETFVAFKEWILSFKELGGRVDFRKNWREYFKTLGRASINGVMVVVDVQDVKRFTDVRNFMSEVITDKLCAGVPVLFILNNHEDSATAVGAAQSMATSNRSAPQAKSKKYTTSKIESKLDISTIAKGHKHTRVFCNVTHMSSDKEIDATLNNGLLWFCSRLADSTPAGQRPCIPKDGFEE